jgi:hypothetical protein
LSSFSVDAPFVETLTSSTVGWLFGTMGGSTSTVSSFIMENPGEMQVK